MCWFEVVVLIVNDIPNELQVADLKGFDVQLEDVLIKSKLSDAWNSLLHMYDRVCSFHIPERISLH